MKRFSMEICNCESGPHVESVEDSEGYWVRFEDAELELEKLSKSLAEVGDFVGGIEVIVI